MIKGIVFDLDGTLVDSIPGIADGVARACLSLGLPEIPESAVRGMVGKGAWKLCERCLDYLGRPLEEEAVLSLEQAFVREYAGTWKSRTVVYPGVGEVLRHLAARGIPLAVLTNKPHDIAVELVRYQFRDVTEFSLIFGAGPAFPRKPDPSCLLHVASLWEADPCRLVMVGDSRTDAETAFNAGVPSVLVDWGYDDDPEGTAIRYGSSLVRSAAELERAFFEAR